MLADNLDLILMTLFEKLVKMLRNILLKKVKITIVNTMSYKELIINIEINTLVR